MLAHHRHLHWVHHLVAHRSRLAEPNSTEPGILWPPIPREPTSTFSLSSLTEVVMTNFRYTFRRRSDNGGEVTGW
jgi:hypothetical protein